MFIYNCFRIILLQFFCNFISNFMTNQITSSLCCFLLFHLYAIILVLDYQYFSLSFFWRYISFIRYFFIMFICNFLWFILLWFFNIWLSHYFNLSSSVILVTDSCRDGWNLRNESNVLKTLHSMHERGDYVLLFVLFCCKFFWDFLIFISNFKTNQITSSLCCFLN